MLHLSGSSQSTHIKIHQKSDQTSTSTHLISFQVKTLPRMESSKFMSNDKATVIIQVNPQVKQHNVIHDDEQQARGAYHNTALKGFFKAQPKALGTVQIMIGVMVFLLGIVLTANFYIFSTISVISGITIWGSFIYISTGSLSVAAQNKLHPCVLKASLGMNVISAITAGISIILMGADIGITTQERPNCRYGYDCLIPQVLNAHYFASIHPKKILLLFTYTVCH
uniref:Membrane-spanning 4-domains, subfamily A, member 17C.1 n=1 Tax=Cyprinus carpio TaxID=7962 RepID=A0A8C2D213_CYPCA